MTEEGKVKLAEQIKHLPDFEVSWLWRLCIKTSQSKVLNIGVWLPLHNYLGKVVAYTLVDREYTYLFEDVRWYVYKSNDRVYATRYGKPKRLILLHRVIMKCPDDKQVDHWNLETLDNRTLNLRVCGYLENARNKPKISGERTSRYKGVVLLPSGTWRARICVAGKNIELGCHATEEEAAKAYDVAAIEHFKEFARINYDD